MWLVTRGAIHGNAYFRVIRRIHLVGDRVTFHGMAEPVFNRQPRNFREIVGRQFHLPIEDRYQLRIRDWCGLRLRTVALHAQRSGIRGPKDVLIVSTVRLMTGCASLLERRLVEIRLLVLFGLICMARQAGIHRIRLHEAGSLSGVRIVTGDALALRTGMLNFRSLDFLALLFMTGQAQRPGICLRQDDFPVFRFCMAGVARIAVERRVHELLHQLRTCRLMRIVTANAVDVREGLPLVGFDQRGIFHVMAVDTKCRRRFLQVVIEFLLSGLSCLVDGVTGIAAAIERSVTTSLLGNSHAGVMTLQAEIVGLISGGRFYQLEWVCSGVGIVALEAVSNCRRMNLALDLGCILVSMTGEAKRLGSCGGQLDPGDVFVDSNFVAACAPCGYRRMDGFALGFVLVAFNAFRGVGVLVEWNGMFPCEQRGACENQTECEY